MTKTNIQLKLKYKVDNDLNISWLFRLFIENYIKSLQFVQNNEN